MILKWKTSTFAFFWRLVHPSIVRRGEDYIPKNTPFCVEINKNGVRQCPYLIATSDGSCCMYKGEQLKRNCEKICRIK